MKLVFTNSSQTSSSSVLPSLPHLFSLLHPFVPSPLQWRVPCCAVGTDSTARVCACATAVGRDWSVTCRRASASIPAVAVTGPAPRAAAPVKQVTAESPARMVMSASTAFLTISFSKLFSKLRKTSSSENLGFQMSDIKACWYKHNKLY